jgi:hypothetical protein
MDRKVFVRYVNPPIGAPPDIPLDVGPGTKVRKAKQMLAKLLQEVGPATCFRRPALVPV